MARDHHSGRRAIWYLLAVVVLVVATACGSSNDDEERVEGPAVESVPPAALEGDLSQSTLVPTLRKALATQKSVKVDSGVDVQGEKYGLQAVLELSKGAVTASDVNVNFPHNREFIHVIAFGKKMFVQDEQHDFGQFTRVDIEDPAAAELVGLSRKFEEILGPNSVLQALDSGMRELSYMGAETELGTGLEHYAATVERAAIKQFHGGKVDPDLTGTIGYDLWLDSDNLIRRLRYDIGDGLGLAETRMAGWSRQSAVEAPPNLH